MTIYPDRPPGLEKLSVSALCNSRTPPVSCCWSGSGLLISPPWKEVKGLCPEIRLLWHHRNNLSVDANGVIWRKRSSQGSRLQLLVPGPARKSLFQAYHASLFGGHLGRNRTLARLSYRFYWFGNVRRCEGLAEAVHNLHKEEVAQQPPSPSGDYSHRPSMGSYCNGYT